MESGTDVRLPAVAGTFYTDDKNRLTNQLEKFFRNTEVISNAGIKAMIVPHAGYIYSGQTAAWGYRQLPTDLIKQHFVLIGPSHHSQFEGLALSHSKYWQTPLGKVEHLSPRIKDQITAAEDIHIPEHCLEVQLPFIQYLYNDFTITSFLTGNGVDYEMTADYFIKEFPKSIFIISSDLSHYLPFDLAEKTDKKTIEAILTSNDSYLLKNDNLACGIMGINIILAIAGKKGWKSKLVYYDTSATESKETSAVVGYAAICFYS